MNKKFYSLIGSALVLLTLVGCSGTVSTSETSQSEVSNSESTATDAELADAAACTVWIEVALPSEKLSDAYQVAQSVQSDLENGTAETQAAFQKFLDTESDPDLLVGFEEKGNLSNYCTATLAIVESKS